MNFLKQLHEQVLNPHASQERLTDMQKLALLSIYSAPTAEMAYESLTGSQNLMAARNQLRSMGLAQVNDQDARAGVSDEGAEALQNNNLIDEVGELTDEGDRLLSKMPNKQESMDRLKALR